MFYKMIMAMVLSALVCGITATQAVEVTAFEDDFNTAPLSAAKWTNATNGWTAISGSQLIVRNKEEIVTQPTFDASSESRWARNSAGRAEGTHAKVVSRYASSRSMVPTNS